MQTETNDHGYTTLETLVETLDRQRETKIDVVCDARSLAVQHTVGSQLRLLPKTSQLQEFIDAAGFELPPKTAQQLAYRLDVEIPGQFLQRLTQQHGDLAAQLLSTLLERTPKKYLLRCLEGRVRAMLSDRYRVLDNYDLAFAALDVARQNDGEVLKCWMTEDNMSVSFTTRQIWDELNEGERRNGGASQRFQHLSRPDSGPDGGTLFHPLVTVTNSETGRGGLGVRYGLLRARCANGALIEDARIERHIGGTLDAGFLSAETIAADARAIMLKCQDAIRAGFHPATFARLMSTAKKATEVPIAQPQAAVANVIAQHNLTESAKDGILAYFLRDYSSTAYGLAQSVARYAQDTDAETGYAMDGISGEILNAPRKYAVAE